jgi:hypothetical protein
MNPEAVTALIRTLSPRNDPPATPKTPEARADKVARLTAELRERMAIGLINEAVTQKAATAMVEILESKDNYARVAVLQMLMKQLPTPEPSKAAVQQGATTVAIQVNAGLRRGKKEFA